MFLRESEGVYRFGQSRVNIKVEKSNNIIVRVGGGFVSVYKFIEMYTPLELRSLKRRTDVVQKFNIKIQTQQIIANRSTMRIENKPVGKHQRAKSASIFMGTKKKERSAIRLEEDKNSVSDHSFDKALVTTFHSQMFDNMGSNSSATAAQTANNANERGTSVSFADVVGSTENNKHQRQRSNNKSYTEQELKKKLEQGQKSRKEEGWQ